MDLHMLTTKRLLGLCSNEWLMLHRLSLGSQLEISMKLSPIPINLVVAFVMKNKWRPSVKLLIIAHYMKLLLRENLTLGSRIAWLRILSKKDPECKELITKCWDHSTNIDPVQALLSSLDSCATSLQNWHQRKYGSMKKNITATQSRVNELNNLTHRDNDNMRELKRAETILDDLLEQEEIYWQQRSRVDWLSSGDRNTKFFHAKASARKSNNKIKSLINEAGVRVHSKVDMAATIHDYFASIFGADTIDEASLSQTLDAIPNMVTHDMNDELTKPFLPAEVESALHSMAPDKSPGIDGMYSMFYQQNWSIAGESVTNAVLSVLNDGVDPTRLNKTIITLIPKIKNPQRVQDYQPISLCNVISKLVSKVLVGRFKHVLPNVILETQSAFLPNRLITDNILVAFELVHAIKNKTAGRSGIATLKLDMSKAFDRVEWRFIQEVMVKMGFATKWVNLIMGCLTTNTFTFLLNGEVTGSLTPSRGLRQGCPLSPYLFLICSEGLSRLLHQEQSMGNLNGFKLTRHAPPISHLLFADDSLLFCQANENSCLAIKRVLDIYHRASGQVLNPEKSVMSFSPNTTLAAQVFFHRHLSMPICECHEKYLGLSSYSGRDKKEMFSGIKEKIWKLMHTWNEKKKSAGGKEVLLKAVVQSIPTYAMSCFRLPMSFCNQVESMMAKFWWGLNENGTKIHWRSWKLLCKRKEDGGMGFRSFVHFNQALLAKQAWRLHSQPDSLLAKLLKCRYYSNNSFHEASLGHSPSLTWQGIHWGKKLLSSGLRWKVGEGCQILCGLDPWIPGHSTFLPFHYNGPANGVVSSLIKYNREWDLDLLQQWFSEPDTERNRVIHGHKAKKAMELSSFAGNYLLNYRSALSNYEQPFQAPVAAPMQNSSIPSASNSHKVPWKPPPTAFSKKLLGSFDPHEMEALAMFHGVHYALNFQFPHLLIETDALRVKNAICSPTVASSVFNDIIMDVSSLLSFFPNVNVSHVKRTANMAADVVVEKGSSPSYYTVVATIRGWWRRVLMGPGCSGSEVVGFDLEGALVGKGEGLAEKEDETTSHILVTCRVVKRCWDRVGIGTKEAHNGTFFDWNEIVCNGKSFQEENMVPKARNFLDQCRCAHNSNNESSWPSFKAGDRTEHWFLPQANAIKVNVDAALFNFEFKFGLDLVARDDKGLLIEGRTLSSHGAIEPELAEAMGV
uniref:Reverse transcriptase domain-containing protein n=1 Tax=Cannabis sativa TaxID=3483 RepID=A0A803QCS5_CANSA